MSLSRIAADNYLLQRNNDTLHTMRHLFGGRMKMTGTDPDFGRKVWAWVYQGCVFEIDYTNTEADDDRDPYWITVTREADGSLVRSHHCEGWEGVKQFVERMPVKEVGA